AREMGWILQAYAARHGYQPGVVTGKPLHLGGSKGREEATGHGVGLVTLWALDHVGRAHAGARVAIQGFGNVGQHAAAFLHERGLKVVAVSAADGGLYDPDGLDIPALLAAMRGK